MSLLPLPALKMATANTAVKQQEGFASLIYFSITNYILVTTLDLLLKANTPMANLITLGLNKHI